SLTFTFVGGTSLVDGLNRPTAVTETSFDEIERINTSIGDTTKADDQGSIVRTYRSRITPYLAQVITEVFGTGVDDLIIIGVVHASRPADKPIAQPLVGNVCAHSIVRG